MYIAYGWPKILKVIDGGEGDSIVHVSVGGGLLVIVSTACIQIWTASQHRIKVGEHVRDSKSIDEDGVNVQALWNAHLETLAVLTSKNVIHFYDVNRTDKMLRLLGPDSPSLLLVRVKFRNSTNIPLFGDDIVIGGVAADDDNILVGLTNGRLHLVSWRGQLRGTADIWKQNTRGILGPMFLPEANGLPSTPISPAVTLNATFTQGSGNGKQGELGVSQLAYSEPLGLLVVVLCDGRVLLCSNAEKGLRPVQDITPEKWVGVMDAVCASISTQQQVLAVGTRRGTVELFNLTENAAYMRTVSLVDWGYSVEDTGPVTYIRWSPDHWAFAVGWKQRGLAVWSVSGCRLMCTIRQGSVSHQNIQSPAIGHGAVLPKNSEPMAYGVAVLAWGEHGYQLLAGEQHNAAQLMQFSFARGCLNKAVAGSANLWQIMQAEDRIVLIQSDEEDELKLQHLVIPQAYMAMNWPVMHVTANDDGSYLAIAGRRGVILYNLRLKKWRVFGDVMQERAVECTGLLWLGKIVVICSHREATNSYELSLYPRYHLDESSLLFRQQLPAKPLALDSWQDYVLVATPPFEVRVFHVSLDGDLSPLKQPTVQLQTVRELSLMSARRPIVAIRFVPRSGEEEWDASHQPGLTTPGATDAVQRQPTRCMILRTDGNLSLLDLDSGSERPLVPGVEHFWITKGRPREEAALIEEVPWWAYGHRGMQVWYPSQQAENPSPSAGVQQLDPELDFDREVYPLGVSPAAGVIVGISQRLSISSYSDFPCFEPSPQAQPILPCLLRHLLQRDKLDEAVELAGLSANRPHFSHSLEWLLFTVFDAEVASQHGKRRNKEKAGTPMLDKACELIRHFPEYLDVVVSVARKTDSRHWGELFVAAGVSSQLFEECFDRKQYRTATCYILVIDKLEGPTVGQQNALRLLQATLQAKHYELAGELVRFLVRSGREYSSTGREDDSSSEGLLKSFFSFGFTNSAPKARADVLHTTVKNILADHALHLLAMKELRELVAFARGTQFDLQEFLRSQEGNAVRLEDFPTALKIIRLKLGDGPQSRADTEYLLEQMNAVGFQEWTLVLATLLRQTDILYNLFRNDLKLWLAYEKTMKVQINASHYEDLLQALRAKLSDKFDHQSIPLMKDS